MKLLLDTHTFLWFIDGNPKLSNYTRDLIKEFNNERFLSIASLWEMSIKASLGKLTLSIPFTKLVAEQIHGNAINLLDISPEHLDVLQSLTFHHKDPFDRLIVSQCISEKITLLSKDKTFDNYSIKRLWNEEL